MIKSNKNNNMKKKKKSGRIRIGIAIIALLCFGHPICGQAETINFESRIDELKAKFPHGKYWNHVGMSTDNSDGYTDNPCTQHKTNGVDHVYGTGGCTCNHFADSAHMSAAQCMGFANKLGHDVFGDTTWTMYNAPTAEQIAMITKGDIVRVDGNHSVFVIARNGNVITVGEANYPNNCIINWDRNIDLTTVTITYYEHANNYDFVINGTQSSPEQGETGNSATEGNNSNTETGETSQPEDANQENTNAPVTEPDGEKKETDENGELYTGWKLTDDGIHYQYYKSGKLEKNKWITVKKKKYYLDENGYRVTGFYDVAAQTYYFNSSGVMQKNKWFTTGGQTYYVNKSGLVLKSQWLYYKNVLVYVTKAGSIAKSEIVKIGSEQYYFDSTGNRSKGFKQCNGKYYYCDSKGIIQKKKWITQKGKKYYLQNSGVRAQSKLLKVGKYQYYFNSKGHMVKNKRVTYKGKIYKADKKGRCKFVENVCL